MLARIHRAGLIAVAVFAVIVGCSDPVSNPKEEVTPFRSGDTLRSPSADVTISRNNGSPWIITEDYVIPEGVTVTVEPGAEVMVAGLWWIDVAGKLIANGSPDNPIIFTSAHSEPDLGQWRGIKLHNSSEASEFRFCYLTYGAYFDTDTLSDRGRDAQNYRGMLAINNSNPVIEHCVITNNQNNGIYLTNSASRPRIRYNIITDNDASAVRGDVTITALTELDIRYNCVADNSAPGFILANDNPDTLTGARRVFGDLTTVNANLDSCDSRFNIDQNPLFVDPAEDLQTRLADFGLQSCSPCVDAGPLDGDFDPDDTPADMGAKPYTQAGFELRGRLEGNLDAATYRMSCDVVIPPGITVTVPAGTRIEATGLFNIEVYGKLLIQGTVGSPVEICPCQAAAGEYVGGIVFFERGDDPSVIEHLTIRNFHEVIVNKAGVRFEGSQFINGFLGGVEIVTGLSSLEDAVVLNSCRFENVGTQAIEVLESSAIIEGAWIHGSRGRGIGLKKVNAGLQDQLTVIIENTIIQSCSTSAIVLDSLCSPRIVNNTISDCGYYGIEMSTNSYPTVLNNIIVNCGRYGLLAEFSSTPLVDYNDIWNNGLRDVVPQNYSPATLDVGETISLDPQFSDGSFHLAGGSPCVNAGHPGSEYNDLDGSRNDIGAWGGPGGTGIGGALRSALLAAR